LLGVLQDLVAGLRKAGTQVLEMKEVLRLREEVPSQRREIQSMRDEMRRMAGKIASLERRTQEQALENRALGRALEQMREAQKQENERTREAVQAYLNIKNALLSAPPLHTV